MSEVNVHRVQPAWKKHALIDNETYLKWYADSVKNPDKFWGKHGKRIDWFKPYKKVKNTSFTGKVSIKWFEDGELNVSYNCIDRHLKKRGDQTAIIWEGDNPYDDRKITYNELYAHVCRFANVLKKHGVKKGDRVTIYMPMIPEAAYAMLACTRLGAIHSIVFGGFSPDALAGRIVDCKSTFVITADEGLRGGKTIPLKENADKAIEIAAGHRVKVKTVLVVRRTGGKIAWTTGRDLWHHEEIATVKADCKPEKMKAEDPLFILYTSGSTGQPKGVLHTTGGYLVFASMTHQYVFDYHDGDIYWCTADVGWVTGHSYIVYGPLANGATTLMFEGVPNYPSPSRFWDVIDKHKVNIFYTAPTAIRALMGAGDAHVKKTSRKSLRVLGSVGEPINPEAWEWYFNVVGDKRCPIVDTWWQTETGGIMITPLPGATDLKPGSATRPFFGVKPRAGRQSRQGPRGCRRRQSLHHRFLAGADAHRLRRPRPLRENLFLDLQGQVFHRRRLPPRRRRLLLDHRPRRRRHQRFRPPHGHGRGRVGAGFARQGVGGRRRRLPPRHQGPGHLLLRDADGRRAPARTNCARNWSPMSARRSAPSPRPTRSSSRPACRRRARARSCGASCARSPRTISARSATPRRWPIRRSSTTSSPTGRTRKAEGARAERTSF